MQPPVFYIEPDAVSDSHAVLNKVESHHAVSVLRLAENAIIIAVDGNGTAYRGEIIHLKKNRPVEIKIHSTIRNFGEPNTIVTLASGLSSGYKFDTVIEKGTELGVRRFVPLICDKGKVKLEDPKRIKNKLTRFKKVSQAAMKQCRRSYQPEIVPPTSFSDFMKEIDSESLNLIFHPSKQAKKLDEFDFKTDYKRVTIIVGPESGFSGEEIALAEEHSISMLSLGGRILRTETAGPVITAVIMHAIGEFR